MIRSFRLYLALWLLMPCMALGEDTAAPAQGAQVARAQFTTAIENREPVDKVAVLSPPADEIFFFTDLRDLQGHTVVHRWRYRGEVVSQVRFEVGGPRWRVFSKKVLEPDEIGEWSVTVVDETDWPLYVELFRYEPDDDLLSGGE
jgi:Protein of unknown function (DUF2914)